jgi:hypothetical protein
MWSEVMSYYTDGRAMEREAKRLNAAEFCDTLAEANAHAADLQRAGATGIKIGRGNGGKYVVTCNPAPECSGKLGYRCQCGECGR